jgi:hypothetical protein
MDASIDARPASRDGLSRVSMSLRSMVAPEDPDEEGDSWEEDEVEGFDGSRKYAGEMDGRIGGGLENDPLSAGFINKVEAEALFDL